MILVFNPGSSSLKAKVFDNNLKELESFKIDRIGISKIKNHTQAAQKIVEEMKNPDEIDVVGSRVVHGGEYFKEPTEINKDVLNKIDQLSPFAPLHNPKAIEVIKISQEMFIRVKHAAFFDTSFFTDLPEESKIYPLPYEYYQKGIKRFGFHGISHQYAMERAALHKKTKIDKLEIITIHLGQGSSIAAIKCGRPIDTSMGYTPLEGLPMMTRSGSIDPGIIIKLITDELKNGKTGEEALKDVENLLEGEAGLYGISGVSKDMRDILFVAGMPVEDKDYQPPKDIKCDKKYAQRAKLAIDVFVRSVKKQVGAYFTLLDKAEAVVFTGEIGYGSSKLREMITQDLTIEVMAIKPNEELAIAEKISKI